MYTAAAFHKFCLSGIFIVPSLFSLELKRKKSFLLTGFEAVAFFAPFFGKDKFMFNFLKGVKSMEKERMNMTAGFPERRGYEKELVNIIKMIVYFFASRMDARHLADDLSI